MNLELVYCCEANRLWVIPTHDNEKSVHALLYCYLTLWIVHVDLKYNNWYQLKIFWNYLVIWLYHFYSSYYYLLFLGMVLHLKEILHLNSSSIYFLGFSIKWSYRLDSIFLIILLCVCVERQRERRADLKLALWFAHFSVMPKRGGGGQLSRRNKFKIASVLLAV